MLEWKGSHLDVTVSPDGRFLVTSMQENALHGWRLADARNMRMTGYPGKTRSLSWSHDGHWLATSGADACVVWPFKDKDGPMGKAPRECGVRSARVARSRFIRARWSSRSAMPTAWCCCAGWSTPRKSWCARRGGGAVSALAWDATGARLLFGLDAGAAGLLTLPA